MLKDNCDERESLLNTHHPFYASPDLESCQPTPPATDTKERVFNKRPLAAIDCLDKSLSCKIQTLELPSVVEYTLILPFALLFNRYQCFAAAFTSAFFAFCWPQYSGQVQSFKGGLCASLIFFCYQVILVFGTLFVTQNVKKLTNRPRPYLAQAFPFKRRVDLTALEHGTCSMPSGDTCQASLWCTLLFFIYGGENILLLMCLMPVMVGFCRVYFQCHYIGDVAIGAAIGFVIGCAGAAMYPVFFRTF